MSGGPYGPGVNPGRGGGSPKSFLGKTPRSSVGSKIPQNKSDLHIWMSLLGSAMHNALFVQLDPPVSKMALYTLQGDKLSPCINRV